jgi:galactose mutarotase-like enzyme
MLSYSQETVYGDLTALILENDHLKISILPEYGGNIWDIFYKSASLSLLWHNPQGNPFRVSKEMVYDDVFFGGWHDIFPNDIHELVDNRELIDHGELWFLNWRYRLVDCQNLLKVELETESPLSRIKLKKTISLQMGHKHFEVDYSIENIGDSAIDYMLKIHAAFNVDEGDEIMLPSNLAYMVPVALTPRVMENTFYEWPFCSIDGANIDMRKVPSRSARISELQCHSELTEGICELFKKKENITIQFSFDPLFFPTIWTFGTYGGWRNLNTLILEPGTGYTRSLNEAKKIGKNRLLCPGQLITTKIRLIVSEN